MKFKSCIGVSIAFLMVSVSAWADTAPECMSGNSAISVDNQEVLNWKQSTRNQYLARAHVEGTVDRVFADHSGHNHFSIQIGPNSTDTLEVVYNESFGALPQVRVGMTVEACGDYITSNAPAGPYPASPDGAIIHWVHMSPSPNRHPSGFLVIDGVVCGQVPGGSGA